MGKTKKQLREEKGLNKAKKQKKKFPEIVEELIKASDVIIEILDARFLDEMRNEFLEKRIINSQKGLIIVANKADLSKNRKFPKEILPISCKYRKGIKKLRQRIKIESNKIKKLDNSKERINIGIIGYPNTGKSSIINILTGKASAGTGSDAGFTKGIQKIKLTSEILLIDSPGVIPSENYSFNSKDTNLQIKLGARTQGKVRDPELFVHELLKDYSEELSTYYGIKEEKDAEIFLENLGKKKNFLIKGGNADMNKTARLVLDDWQKGRIKI
ncbi:MAG: GTPase [Nanoarchaeota archaeon]